MSHSHRIIDHRARSDPAQPVSATDNLELCRYRSNFAAVAQFRKFSWRVRSNKKSPQTATITCEICKFTVNSVYSHGVQPPLSSVNIAYHSYNLKGVYFKKCGGRIWNQNYFTILPLPLSPSHTPASQSAWLG